MKSCPVCDGFGRKVCPSCRSLWSPDPNCIHCHGNMVLPILCPSCNGARQVPNYFLPSYDPYLEQKKEETVNELKQFFSRDKAHREEGASMSLMHLGVEQGKLRYGQTDFISILREALRSEISPKVRQWIIRALRNFSQLEALEAMNIAINDSDSEVRAAIAGEVRFFVNDCFTCYYKHPQEQQILQPIISQAKKMLIQLSADPHPGIREFANIGLQKRIFK